MGAKRRRGQGWRAAQKDGRAEGACGTDGCSKRQIFGRGGRTVRMMVSVVMSRATRVPFVSFLASIFRRQPTT